ncbi:pheromone A receptor-domain-containing protein [Mycena vitilis]|nr:pheromone A receptor-domain-containing protein [Mycena vitilis]
MLPIIAYFGLVVAAVSVVHTHSAAVGLSSPYNPLDAALHNLVKGLRRALSTYASGVELDTIQASSASHSDSVSKDPDGHRKRCSDLRVHVLFATASASSPRRAYAPTLYNLSESPTTSPRPSLATIDALHGSFLRLRTGSTAFRPHAHGACAAYTILALIRRLRTSARLTLVIWTPPTVLPDTCRLPAACCVVIPTQRVPAHILRNSRALRAHACPRSLALRLDEERRAVWLCINRRLYQIASVKVVPISNAEKRRAALIDALICVLFPLVYVALQYIVQGHRFNIYEQIGCYPALYNSLPMFFVSTIWPPLVGCVSAVYGVLSLRAFTKRRAAFAQFLAPPPSPNSPYSAASSSSSALPGLTASRYLRLMALSFTAVLLTTPLGILAIALNATATPVSPWRSLSGTHFDFARVEQVPAFMWRGARLVQVGVEFTRWTAPLTALVFFAFFGFAVEARKQYARALAVVGTPFARVRPGLGFTAAEKGIGYTKPPPTFKRTVDVDISLPAYSPSAGTGSFTAGELKRAPSSSSSFGTSSFSASTYAYPADASHTHGYAGDAYSEHGDDMSGEDEDADGEDDDDMSGGAASGQEQGGTWDGKAAFAAEYDVDMSERESSSGEDSV